MSVLVKGMEMPNSCRECKLRDDMACCLPLDTPYEDRWVGKNEDKREPDCPLIEIPEHGDLVDVDDLEEWIENWFEKDRYYHPFSKGKTIPTEELRDIFKSVPVVIPAERSEE